MNQEEQLKNLKRKILDKKNKVEAMVFELRELNEAVNSLKFPENKDYSIQFKDLNDSIITLTDKINELKQVKVTNLSEAKTEIPEYPKITIPEYPKEIKVSNLQEIPAPQINVKETKIDFPEKFKVSNLDEIKLPEIKTEKVEFPKEFKISNLDEIKQPIIETKEVNFPDKLNIDWENAPKQKEKVIDIGKPIKTLENAIEQVLKVFFNEVYIFFDRIIEYIKEPDKIIVSEKEITEWYGKKKISYRIRDDGIKMELTREN